MLHKSIIDGEKFKLKKSDAFCGSSRVAFGDLETALDGQEGVCGCKVVPMGILESTSKEEALLLGKNSLITILF